MTRKVFPRLCVGYKPVQTIARLFSVTNAGQRQSIQQIERLFSFTNGCQRQSTQHFQWLLCFHNNCRDFMKALTRYLAPACKAAQIRLRLWSASVYCNQVPPTLQMFQLTEPLRNPPVVVREVAKDFRILGVRYLVSWCFEPSQPQRITLGLNTNLILSPSYSFHKSLYHRSFF